MYRRWYGGQLPRTHKDRCSLHRTNLAETIRLESRKYSTMLGYSGLNNSHRAAYGIECRTAGRTYRTCLLSEALPHRSNFELYCALLAPAHSSSKHTLPVLRILQRYRPRTSATATPRPTATHVPWFATDLVIGAREHTMPTASTPMSGKTTATGIATTAIDSPAGILMRLKPARGQGKSRERTYRRHNRRRVTRETGISPKSWVARWCRTRGLKGPTRASYTSKFSGRHPKVKTIRHNMSFSTMSLSQTCRRSTSLDRRHT